MFTISTFAMRSRGSDAVVGEAFAKSISTCPRTTPFSFSWRPSRVCATWKVRRAWSGSSASAGLPAAVMALALGCEKDSTAALDTMMVGLMVA
ncbi:MAG: hypothetical protein AB1730_18180 [Myxococcota bacterium]